MTPPPSEPARRAHWTVAVEGLALLLVVAAGAWLRWRCLAHAYDPDELSTLYHGATVGALVTDPETAVNPPLFRVLFDVPFPETWGIWLGRRASFVASALTIPVVHRVARDASGSRLAGLLAAALVASHPGAVVMGARFRAYALWGLTLALLLVAIGRWAAAPTRRHAVAVAALAFLLPQWNYLGAAMLLAMAAGGLSLPSTRTLWRLFVPAAVGILPLVPALIGGGDTRVAHQDGLASTLHRFLALDVTLDRALWNQVAARLPVPEASDLPKHLGGWATGALVVVSLFGHRPALHRVLLGGTIGTYAAIAAASQVQYVRSPVSALLVVLVAPLVASAAAPLTWRLLRGPATAAAAALVGFSFPSTADRSAGVSVYAALPDFLHRVHDFDAVRGDAPITVWPTWTFIGTHFFLTGTHIRAREGEVPPPCPLPCYEEQGIVWMTIPERGPHVAPYGLVAAFREPPDGFADG